MDDKLIKILNASKICSSLNEEEYKLFLSQIEELHLKKGDVLFHQGDTSDAIYILVKGELSAILITSNNSKIIVGRVLVGETVGELGVLSGEPRTLTIEALEDSHLVKLSNTLFNALCHHHPNIIHESVKFLVHRSRSTLQLLDLEQKASQYLFIPINTFIPFREFREQIKDQLEEVDHDAAIIIEDELLQTPQPITNASLSELVHDLQKTKSTILFFPSSYESILFKYCLTRVDKVYLVASASDKIHVHGALTEYFLNPNLPHNEIRELILMQPQAIDMPVRTSQWLNDLQCSFHHHVRLHNRADYAKLLRFICNKATGLVLSGGGNKGWVHVGAIKAMEDANIPIDIIGGTSMGALIGGIYALNKNHDSVNQAFVKVVKSMRKSGSWKNIVWPVISLFNGTNFTLSQQELFGEIEIEDLWTYFFCISSNLAQYKEVVHTRGKLWEKLRASASVPGLIPPMLIDHELHVDGGILNNLPVDVMRKLVGKGTIIAVDIAGEEIDNNQYSFPPSLSFTQSFISKWLIKNSNHKFPPFFETFMKAMLLGSASKTQENRLTADIIIKPKLNKFSALSSSDKFDQILFSIGYNETLSEINKWQDSAHTRIL